MISLIRKAINWYNNRRNAREVTRGFLFGREYVRMQGYEEARDTWAMCVAPIPDFFDKGFEIALAEAWAMHSGEVVTVRVKDVLVATCDDYGVWHMHV